MTEEIKEEVAKAPEVIEPEPQDSSDKLSNREALQLAIEQHKEPEKTEAKKEVEVPTQKEVKQAVDADLEPPSDFNDKERKAWENKDIRGIQEGYRRVNTLRLQELSRAQTAEKNAELRAKTAESLTEKVREYLTLRGDGSTPTEAQIAEAVQLVAALKKSDGKAIREEFARAGIKLDSENSTEKNIENTISPLLKKVESLESYIERQQLNETVSQFEKVFGDLGSQKTRTGEKVFPDLFDQSEKGRQLARELGSLIQDERFRAGVLRRIPDATLTDFVREGYKFLGGRVAGEAVIVSENTNPKQIEKQRRAAASTPGGVMRRQDTNSLVGKLSNRAALKKALEDHQEH